jgi:hypothetical protein
VILVFLFSFNLIPGDYIYPHTVSAHVHTHTHTLYMFIFNIYLSAYFNFVDFTDDGKLVAESDSGEFWVLFGGFAPIGKKKKKNNQNQRGKKK